MPTLVEALTVVVLLAATLQYAIVIRHREERRDLLRWQAELRESLVSVGTDDGARFHVER